MNCNPHQKTSFSKPTNADHHRRRWRMQGNAIRACRSHSFAFKRQTVSSMDDRLKAYAGVTGQVAMNTSHAHSRSTCPVAARPRLILVRRWVLCRPAVVLICRRPRRCSVRTHFSHHYWDTGSILALNLPRGEQSDFTTRAKSVSSARHDSSVMYAAHCRAFRRRRETCLFTR